MLQSLKSNNKPNFSIKNLHPWQDPYTKSPPYPKIRISLLSWVCLLLGCSILSLIISLGAKKRPIAKGKVVDVEDEDEGRLKKEKKNSMASEWVSFMPKRSARASSKLITWALGQTCDKISNQGLDIFFDAFPGYDKNLVVNSYSSMKIDVAEQTIEAMVGVKKIEVTPDIIASYLRYNQPDACTFPNLARRITNVTFVHEIYENVNLLKGKFSIGKMKPNYQLLNKVVHHNLFPRGSERIPMDREVELLFAFLNGGDVIDFALCIFHQICEFKTEAINRANVPLPAMITVFWPNQSKVKVVSTRD